jgi:hypothetical protein
VSPAVPIRKKTKTPEEKIENDGGGSDGAEEMRLAKPADHRRIGNAKQWRRHMGERHRQREPGYVGMTDLRGDFPQRLGEKTPRGSAGVAHIHEPQHQPNGNDDRGPRENVISNLTDRIKAKAPDAIDDVFDPAKYIHRPDVEPHQKSADDQGHEDKPQEDAAGRAAQKTV